MSLRSLLTEICPTVSVSGKNIFREYKHLRQNLKTREDTEDYLGQFSHIEMRRVKSCEAH